MDSFFRAEAVRGVLTALRSGKGLEDSVADGKALCEIAVQIWNTRREWQVHRSSCWVEDFIRREIQLARGG